MVNRDIAKIVANCNRFLSHHTPATVRDRAQAVADSPLSLIRNDGYGNGGYLADFEVEIAGLLGKEAAVFMPSGTMAQQIALRIWSDRARNNTVAFHPTCHLEIHEQSAYRELHGLESVLIGDPSQLFTLEDLRNVTRPISSLLIELPQREIGGQLPSWEELTKICSYAQSKGMRLHMDGARLWECAPFYSRPYAEIAGLFDSVYVSFYKILNGFPGSILAGPADFIAEAKVWQRRHGGNLHQQSVNVISAKLGLEIELPRIPQYVSKAQEIARVLADFAQIRVIPDLPQVNMMHLYFQGDSNRYIDAALQIADADHIWLFGGLGPEGKWEFTVASGALEFSETDIKSTFAKLISLATE